MGIDRSIAALWTGTRARLWLILSTMVLAAAAPVPGPTSDAWVTSWATAPMRMEGEHALPPSDGRPVMIRQTVRLSIAGGAVRVRVSNRYGTAPLRVEALAVGRAAQAGADRAVAGTEQIARFGGDDAVTIPAGAEYWTDPIPLRISPLARLTLSLRVVADGVATGHPGGRGSTFLTIGNGAPVRVTRWYYLSAVDVLGQGGGAIAVLGDSIADGFGVKDDSDTRWTDYLSARLQADPATRRLAVANQGIGGNRILLDGTGPNALARLDADVLGLSGLRHMIVHVGVNDLGMLTRDAPAEPAVHAAMVRQMIAGYRQIVQRARARGICIIGATILPYGGSRYYHPDKTNEADRQALNAWLRGAGNFDAVIDFDAALRDPTRQDRLRAEVDSGDGLHPSDAGYRAMAATAATVFQSRRLAVRCGSVKGR